MRFVPGALPVIKHIFHKTTVKIFTTTSSNPTRGWTQPMSVSGVTPMYVSTGTQYQRHHYHFIITSSFKKLGAWPTFKGRGCDPGSPPSSLEPPTNITRYSLLFAGVPSILTLLKL